MKINLWAEAGAGVGTGNQIIEAVTNLILMAIQIIIEIEDTITGETNRITLLENRVSAEVQLIGLILEQARAFKISIMTNIREKTTQIKIPFPNSVMTIRQNLINRMSPEIKLIKNEPTFLQCHSYHLGFWNHHFIKVKILKYVFSSDFSDISCFNKLIRDDNILYFSRGIFPKTTPRQSIETMIDGLPTELGMKYLNNMNVSIT